MSLRSKRLPLMMAGYFDVFGSKVRAFHQRVLVEPCQPSGECSVQPMPLFGAAWSTGSPEPGLYYLGIFNDPSYATEPISNYTLSARSVQLLCRVTFEFV